jgi:hypothetical protein
MLNRDLPYNADILLQKYWELSPYKNLYLNVRRNIFTIVQQWNNPNEHQTMIG